MSRVFVGLSGGVDSAVSAALLQREGHDVTGVFIRIWQPEFLECTWEEDRLSAKRVAAALGIPFREVDLSDAYKKRVVDDMISAYERGETPNPDVLCNEYIKFGAFRDWAYENGAEKIATGHYARIKDGKLLRGVDNAKDQSYFLHRLSQSDLERVIFPVGGYEKAAIRRLARSFDLPNAARKDSQGLCFVGDIDLGEFLSRYRKSEPGAVLDRSGKTVGKHEGYMRYTIGERHGFEVATPGSPEPHFVIGIDPKRNTITVSGDAQDAARREVRIRDAHWVGKQPERGRWYEVEVRYHQIPQRARLEDGKAIFEEPQIVAPGQSVVFYDGDVCLGGGFACA